MTARGELWSSAVRQTAMKRLALFAVVVLAGCGSANSSSSDTTDPSPASTTTTTTTVAQPKGEVATWRIESAEDVAGNATSFPANVSRLGCNDGETGEVLAPTIELDASQIVVTFTVAPAEPGGHTCPSNDIVKFVVDVGEPIGNRELVDGACRNGSDAATTSWCADGAVRWAP